MQYHTYWALHWFVKSFVIILHFKNPLLFSVVYCIWNFLICNFFFIHMTYISWMVENLIYQVYCRGPVSHQLIGEQQKTWSIRIAHCQAELSPIIRKCVWCTNEFLVAWGDAASRFHGFLHITCIISNLSQYTETGPSASATVIILTIDIKQHNHLATEAHHYYWWTPSFQ